jgi:hypothetical protein
MKIETLKIGDRVRFVFRESSGQGTVEKFGSLRLDRADIPTASLSNVTFDKNPTALARTVIGGVGLFGSEIVSKIES